MAVLNGIHSTGFPGVACLLRTDENGLSRVENYDGLMTFTISYDCRVHTS